MSDQHELGDVESFTTGAVGHPGQRVFFLQARRGVEHVTIKCEKQQVDALATYLGQLLTDLPAPDDLPLPISLELVEPIDSIFVLGGIGVAWDQHNDRVVLSFEEVVDADDETSTDDDSVRATVQLSITRGQALAFARRGHELVAAGRPACRYCGLPEDPGGHSCPRMN